MIVAFVVCSTSLSRETVISCLCRVHPHAGGLRFGAPRLEAVRFPLASSQPIGAVVATLAVGVGGGTRIKSDRGCCLGSRRKPPLRRAQGPAASYMRLETRRCGALGCTRVRRSQETRTGDDGSMLELRRPFTRPRHELCSTMKVQVVHSLFPHTDPGLSGVESRPNLYV